MNSTCPDPELAALCEALDGVDAGTVILRREDSMIEFVSPRARTLLGLSPELPVQCEVASLEPPSVADWLTRAVDVSQQEPGKGNLELVTPHGSRSVMVSGSHTVSHQVLLLQEQPPSGPGAEQTEASLHDFIDVLPLVIIVLDGSKVVYANLAALRFFGYSSLDAALQVDVKAHIFADDHPAHERRTRELSRGEHLPLHEYRVYRHDGSLAHFEVRTERISWRGKPCAAIFARDTTDRRAVEQQLLKSDRLAALGTLAGGLAHELNNPLTYLLLGLYHLTQRLPEFEAKPELIQDALGRLREAYDGAERVGAIVRRMSEFAHADVDSELRPVSVHEALEPALAIVSNEIKHRGRLSTRLEPVPPVRAQAGRLEHALRNLLVYVVRNLPDSDLTPEIRLRTGVEEGEVAIQVWTNVPTFDPEQLDLILDPHVAVQTGRRVDLGLAVSRSILNWLGGDLKIQRREGGTGFTILLPAADEGNKKESVPPSSANVVVGRARILVIDDEASVGKALHLMLHEEHDVTTLRSAREGLRVLLTEPAYDVIFCDLGMPEVGGADIYQALRFNRPGYERKLVFMTGGARAPAVSRFLRRVPNLHVEKPFDQRAVRRCVRRILHP